MGACSVKKHGEMSFVRMLVELERFNFYFIDSEAWNKSTVVLMDHA